MFDEEWVETYLGYAAEGVDLSNVRIEFNDLGCHLYDPNGGDPDMADNIDIEKEFVNADLWSKFVATFGDSKKVRNNEIYYVELDDEGESSEDLLALLIPIHTPEVSPERQAIRDSGDAHRKTNTPLFAHITKVLYEYDLVNLSSVAPADEYDPEAGTILARYANADFLSTADELAAIIREEFEDWFGEFEDDCTIDFVAIANDIINMSS